MGTFFNEVFLPSMKKLVEAGLSYDDVKRVVKISTTWGARIRASSSRIWSMHISRNEERLVDKFMLTSEFAPS